jgi:hypothetical protein
MRVDLTLTLALTLKLECDWVNWVTNKTHKRLIEPL